MASICRSCSLEVLGVEVEPQENCSVSESDCGFSMGGLGFDQNVGTSVSCMGGVDPDHCGKSEARPGDVCPSMPNTTGSYGCIRRYTVRFAAHEALSVVAQEQKTPPSLRSLAPPHSALLGRPSSHVEHKLAGDEGCISSSKTLSPRPEGLPCVGVDGQLFSNLLHKLPG